MRYLILADIHANIDALEAINESFDRVLFLGDLVDYGPAPEEAIQWIRKAEATGVRGNHDFAMATGADCRSSPVSYAISVATREHFRPLISRDSLEYLRDLPEKSTSWAEDTPFTLMHATPRDSIYEYLGGDAGDAAWRSAVGDLANDRGWLLLGHTHKPFVQQIGPLTIVMESNISNATYSNHKKPANTA